MWDFGMRIEDCGFKKAKSVTEIGLNNFEIRNDRVGRIVLA